jgi:hypothetical protein
LGRWHVGAREGVFHATCHGRFLAMGAGMLRCCGAAGVGYTAGRREVDGMRMRTRMRVRILCREGWDERGIASHRIASHRQATMIRLHQTARWDRHCMAFEGTQARGGLWARCCPDSNT